MFRAHSAHHQEVNDANCTYAASGIFTLVHATVLCYIDVVWCQLFNPARFVIPDGRILFVQFYFDLSTWICLTRGWYALHRSHRTM
jgi:hypothetical protein